MKFNSGERVIDYTQHQKGYRRPIDKLRPMTSLLILFISLMLTLHEYYSLLLPILG